MTPRHPPDIIQRDLSLPDVTHPDLTSSRQNLTGSDQI